MTKSSWRLLFSLFAILAVFGVAVACGDDDDDDDGGTGGTTTGTATATSDGGDVDLADDQIFRVNLGGAPDTLDPAVASFATELSVIENIFRGPFRINQELEIVPELASELPTKENGGISEDGLVYTIKFKDGIKWSDGKAITSADMAFALRRSVSPRSGGDYASFLYDIKGADALSKLKPDDPGIEAAEQALGIETPDDKTIRITLTAPNALFVNYMTIWIAFPMREDLIEEHGDAWIQAGNLVSSGPFVLKEWVQADHITLEPNPEYHAEKPIVTIRFAMIEDANQAYNAYKAGELDQVSVPSALVPEVKADPEVSKEIVSIDRLVTFRTAMVITKAPFDNEQVRQAFAYAVDREALVEVALKGVGKAATSFIPPGLPGYDENLEPNYNPDKAKQLLKDAGFENGEGLPAITFTYTNAGNNPPLATFLQQQWKQVLGVEVALEPVDSQTFQQRFKDGLVQIAFVGWGADYPDPESFLGPNFRTGAGNNKSLWSNAEYDDLIDKGLLEPDREKAFEDYYKKAQEIIHAESPDIFLFYSQGFSVRKPWVKELTQTGMDHQVMGDRWLEFVKIAKH